MPAAPVANQFLKILDLGLLHAHDGQANRGHSPLGYGVSLKDTLSVAATCRQARAQVPLNAAFATRRLGTVLANAGLPAYHDNFDAAHGWALQCKDLGLSHRALFEAMVDMLKCEHTFLRTQTDSKARRAALLFAILWCAPTPFMADAAQATDWVVDTLALPDPIYLAACWRGAQAFNEGAEQLSQDVSRLSLFGCAAFKLSCMAAPSHPLLVGALVTAKMVAMVVGHQLSKRTLPRAVYGGIGTAAIALPTLKIAVSAQQIDYYKESMMFQGLCLREIAIPDRLLNDEELREQMFFLSSREFLPVEATGRALVTDACRALNWRQSWF